MRSLRKFFLLSTLILLPLSMAQAQEIYATVHNGLGISIVDAGNQLGVGQTLDNTNRFAWFGSIEGLYLLPSGYLVGVEFAAHRLYSYQWIEGSIRRTNTVITYHPGAIAGIIVRDNFYIKAGVNLRAYSDGGLTPGAMIALDYSLPVNRSFSLPIGLRSDIIIDTPTVLSLSATIGLRYFIEY